MDNAELVLAVLALTVLPAVSGTVIGCFCSGKKWVRLSTVLCTVSCCAGVFAYPLWCAASDITVRLGLESAIGAYAILIDRISALMITVSSGVYLLVVIHLIGSSGEYSGRYVALLNALYLACFFCMCADSVAVLIMGWESVSLLTFLMAFRKDDEHSRWMFFIVTHIGGLILLGIFAYLASLSGSFILSDWDSLSSQMSSLTASAVIVLLFIGFGSKLGTIPFHAWMPDMYMQTPTHTTVLLSTVCSNVAILVLFKSVFGYVGMTDGLEGAALILIALSSMSALWGAFESLVENKPKRILAYSSMENMALVTLCMSMAIMFSSKSAALTSLVLIAAILHTINHSIFKSLMLLAVHTVEDSTGENVISRFGGLGKKFPLFSMIALIGTASLAAIPPMNGFVSEWLMIQSMIIGDASQTVFKLVMPLTVGVLGVCGMMAATSYVRLYGFTFLGRPRSEGAMNPKPISKPVMFSLGIFASMCVAFGLFAMEFTDVINGGLEAFTGYSGDYKAAISGSFQPLVLGGIVFGTIIVIYLISRIRSAPASEEDTWGCGGELDEMMQYSSTGFSQPLVRVFHPIYGDVTEMSSDDDGRHTVYRIAFTEPFVKYIYRPIGFSVQWLSKQVEKLQTGNIQSYLGYMLVVLVVAILGVRIL